MAKRQQVEENHWPGFVDALSTIIMVVTFLLIILGIAIFVLSQNVAKQRIQAAQAEVEVDVEARTMAIQSLLQEKIEEIEELKSTLRSVQGISSSATKRGERAIVRQDNAVDSDIDIATRSTAVAPNEVVRVNPEVDDENDGSLTVTEAASLLTLNFEPNVVDLDDGTTDLVQGFINKLADELDGRTIEIQSIAASDVASVSEAKRLAYYRAIAVRNALLQAGIPAELIKSKIKPSDGEDEDNQVFLIVK